MEMKKKKDNASELCRLDPIEMSNRIGGEFAKVFKDECDEPEKIEDEDEVMSDEDYDRNLDEHVELVAAGIDIFIKGLQQRAKYHDSSKRCEPERSAFKAMIPKSKGLNYGSKAYSAITAELGEVLKHHYANNRHHPQHFAGEGNKISQMDLFDIIEMLCDWAAANRRNPNGDIYRSIDIAVEKHGIEPQLAWILRNTADSIADENGLVRLVVKGEER